MNFIKALMALAALITPLAFSAEQPKPLYTLYTATPKGTYYQFGLDIKRACPALNIQVVASEGSLDNINQLIQPPVFKAGHRFAFVQNDAFGSVLTSEPKVRALVKPVLPLYTEDISIVVNRGAHIEALKDLEGRRVAVGVVGSGTWFSAAAIRSQLGINWISIERAPEESILAVLIGDLDAMIMVGGHPIKLYSELGLAMKQRVKLLGMSDPALDKLYTLTKLPAGTYLWQEEAVDLRATRSNLIASADVPQAAVNELLNCIILSQTELRHWGHPQWSNVTFPQIRMKRSK